MPDPKTPGPATPTESLQPKTPFPSPPADLGAPLDPDTLSPDDIRAQIAVRERDMKYHLAAIRHEVMGVGDDVNIAGRPLTDWLRANPVASLAAAVGAGALVGVVLGARSRSRRRPDPDDGLDFVRARTALLLDEAAWKVAGGATPDDALRATLKTTPVVYADRQPVVAARSALADTVDVAVKSAVGFLLKAALDQLTQKLTGHEETFAAVADATSDG